MMAVAIIIIIVFAVAVVLIAGWGGTSNDLVNGLFEFFGNLLSGQTVPSGGLPN